MFINVKRLKQMEDLINEANIIRYGDEFAKISSEVGEETGDSENPVWTKIDYLLDELIRKGVVDLEKEASANMYSTAFTSEKGKAIAKAYIEYCKKRIIEFKDEIQKELEKQDPDSTKIDELMKYMIILGARVETLQQIYQAFSRTDSTVEDVETSINSAKDDLSKAYENPIRVVSNKVKADLLHVRDGDTQREGKEESVRNVLTQFAILEEATKDYPPEVKEGVKQARQQAEQTIKSAIGEQRFNELAEEVLTNRHEADILRRILAMKYTDFKSEEEIYRTVDSIKISINGLEAQGKNKPRSKPEVIEFLNKQLDEAAEEALRKAREKSISVDKATGIRYDFNVRLKLHEAVDLPVTGKQIADATWVMKARKGLMAFLNTFVLGTLPASAASDAWGNLGAAIHKAYALTLNKTASIIGKAVGGRRGEMKADAISRLFIPDTGVLDKKPYGSGVTSISTKVNEEGGAPGMAIQQPGSIGGMGPIHAPTQTQTGSGDNFNSEKKKKKKKVKSVFEEQVKVLSFASFIAENKNGK